MRVVFTIYLVLIAAGLAAGMIAGFLHS